MLIGYARVSTKEQNLDAQVEALKGAGCEQIFTDKASGTRNERPGFSQVLQTLRAGDTLVVWKLDRLGRSVLQLVKLANELAGRSVQLISLTDAINTSTPSGRFFFNVMASLAEVERSLIIERTQAGLDRARKLGRKGGRPRRMTDDKVQVARRLLADGTPPCDVAHTLGVSVPVLYHWVPASTR